MRAAVDGITAWLYTSVVLVFNIIRMTELFTCVTALQPHVTLTLASPIRDLFLKIAGEFDADFCVVNLANQL